MNIIQTKILDFLEKLCYNKASPETIKALSEDFSKEFSRRIEKTLLENNNKEFSLRLSAMGKSLRQLLLEKKHGRPQMKPEFMLKMLYGHLYEALFFCLIKYAGITLDEKHKRVILKVNDKISIPGEYDFASNGIWDIKTASPYAYQYKFVDWMSLLQDDGFGYFTQGFGYSEAEDLPFRGWIVIDKSSGEFKIIEIPEEEQKKLREKYYGEICSKAKHITDTPEDIPPCTGVLEETFNGKPTGNKYLDDDCRWCSYKEHCHRKVTYCEDVNSKAKKKTMKYYIGEIKRNDTK